MAGVCGKDIGTGRRRGDVNARDRENERGRKE